MSVLDLASGNVTHRVKVGEEPEGVTVRPDGREVYVTSEGDNAVFAIDTTSFAVVAKMRHAARPRAVAFTPDGTTAFVTNENGGAITVVDAAKHTVTSTIKLTAPRRRDRPAATDGRRRSRRTRASCSSRWVERSRSWSSTWRPGRWCGRWTMSGHGRGVWA